MDITRHTRVWRPLIGQQSSFLSSDMKKLFDVAHQNLVEDLKTDRVRNNLGMVTEDLEFYLRLTASLVLAKLPIWRGRLQFRQPQDNPPPSASPRSVKPRSNTITVRIPRDLLNAEMTKSLDRAKTSDGRAMEIISPLLKTFKTLDGKPLSLDRLTISRSSIWRKWIKYRDQISDEAFEEFQVNMPEHCILHWDSKALADMDGVMHEI